jgi:hypothetical protein
MARTRFMSIAALSAAILSMIVVAPPAQAVAPVPFTITESNFVFGEGFSADADFVATGPLCPVGRLHDEYVILTYPAPKDRVNTVFTETTYTCADGSGTFNMQKEARLIATAVNNQGPVTLHGGTGAYVKAVGHGTDVGANGVGHITGTVSLG